MNKINFNPVIAGLAGLIAALSLASCTDEPLPVIPHIVAGLSSPSANSRAITGGEIVDPITAYEVVFYKVEIGNSETDRFTLWENTDGETKDIADQVAFDKVQSVVPGTYQYVRLTVGPVLSVDGSITDPANQTVYTGSGTCQLTETVYLWGTNIDTDNGELTLQAPITITEGCTLNFGFQIAGTVTYQGGTQANANLSVSKPVMTLSIE